MVPAVPTRGARARLGRTDTSGRRPMTITTIAPSRRDILAGAAGIAGAAALRATPVGLEQAPAPRAGLPVRRDIATFGADDRQIARIAGAIQEMMDRSARDPN